MEKGVWKEKWGGCCGRRKNEALCLVMFVFFVFLFVVLLFVVFLGGRGWFS